MLKNRLIDGIVPEPLGGAHHDPENAGKSLKSTLKRELKTLKSIPEDALVAQRIAKFSSMGVVESFTGE
jgi:acetyl-CoA carboxylase carboxyl transferase subunit alpha